MLIRVIFSCYRINFERLANKFVSFKFDNIKIIIKCELNAYLFLRYLRLLFVILVSLAFLIFFILLLVNLVSNDNLKYKITSLN